MIYFLFIFYKAIKNAGTEMVAAFLIIYFLSVRVYEHIKTGFKMTIMIYKG